MAKSGYLHVGLPKTATTSCQEALYNHRDLLLKQHGYFYPSVAVSHNSMLAVMFLDDPRSHITVKSKGITSRDEAEALRRRYFARMEADIASVPWDRLVLSSEGLSNLPPASLARLKEWLRRYAEDWTVLFWSRHPVAYTTSNVQQLVKSGETLEGLYGKLPLPNLKRRLQHAFEVFGRDRIRLTAFEDAKAEPGGAVAAFCRRLDLPEATALEIGEATPPTNESMSMLATLLMSHLNRQRPRLVEGGMNPRRRHGEIQLFQRIKGEKFRLPPEVEAEVRRRSSADVAWLNETFGTSLYLNLFEEVEQPAAKGPEPYDPEMLDSLSLLISDLINRKDSKVETVSRGLASWWRRRSA